MRHSRHSYCLFVTLLCIGTAPAIGQAPPTVEASLASYGVSDSIPSLVEALRNPNHAVRGLAAGALAMRGQSAEIPEIERALNVETDQNVKVIMAKALADLHGQTGINNLIATCNDVTVSPDVRLQAAQAALDHNAQRCTRSVVDILARENVAPSSLSTGLQYLSRTTSTSPETMPVVRRELASGLSSQNPMDRVFAAEALSIFGDAQSERELQDALNGEKNAAVRDKLDENLKRLRVRLAGSSGGNKH